MKRFDIYNFVSKDDDFRPSVRAIHGVFHDKGYKVATDAIVLIAVKSDYPDELEHHSIGIDGAEIIGKYPDWRGVLPSGKEYKPYRIDIAKFESFIKERRDAWKDSFGKGTKWGQYQWNVQVGPACFRAHKFEMFLTGMKEIGATEIFVMDKRRTAYAKTDKGWVLIFPIMYVDNGYDPDTVKLA